MFIGGRRAKVRLLFLLVCQACLRFGSESLLHNIRRDE